MIKDLLKGKVAVVTGGTRGIGFAIVKTYLEQGATVVMCGSRQETVDKAMDLLKSENKDFSVEGLVLDLKNQQAIDKEFERINSTYKSIDILVNNAGVSSSTPIENYQENEFENVIDLNVNSIYKCTKAAVKYMKAQKSGVILNTSSMVSICGQPGGEAYPASKFAVNGLTISLARELGKDSIRVNAVAPGVTNTDMMRAVPEDIIKGLAARIPLGRIGEPQDVANAFLYLASDLASYVTGVVLSVDGLART